MKLKDLRNAWLSPDGEIIDDHDLFHGGSFHYDLGICILMDIMGLKSRGEVMDYDLAQGPCHCLITDLEDRGYMRLHGFGSITPIWIKTDDAPNQIQRAVIKAWCDMNDRDIHSCFNE